MQKGEWLISRAEPQSPQRTPIIFLQGLCELYGKGQV